MKPIKLLGIALSLSLLAACSKDEPGATENPVIEKKDPLEYARDSISYSINGITYTTSKFMGYIGSSNLESNAKVDSIVNNAYYISGDKDSVLFAKTFGISDEKRSNKVSFIKTYNKEAMQRVALLVPKDLTDIFKIGTKNYALDFDRDNKQNGVALSIRHNNISYKTYGSDSFRTPPLLSPDAQKGSKFEVISLKELKSGTYILEAKFNARVFDEFKNSLQLENGYLRLRIDFVDLYL